MRAWAAPILCLAVTACGGPVAALTDAGIEDATPIGEPLPPVDGGAGYALSFDGVDDYATAGNGGFTTPEGTMTIELWVRFESGGTDQDFIVLRLNLESGLRIGIHAGTIAARRIFGDRVLTAAPALPSVNQWHHVAYTFDYTTNVLYVDGAQVDAQTTAPDDRTPNQVWLGSIDGVNALFRGEMDEVRVWAITRSAAEIRADMKHGPVAGQSGTDALIDSINGLVAYWTFDDDRSGGRSVDRSGRGNDVTLGDGVAQRMPARVPSDAPVSD
jgi:hypothetical protein